MAKNTLSDNNITITEIFSGIKAKMRYFGKHSLDANGDVMPFNEQMAIVSHYLHNEKYASEKMRRVNTIVNMTDKICEQFGYERAWGKGNENDTIINKLAVSINDDGSMSIFAELEKMSEKQKDYIEKLREKQSEEKKTSEKSEEKKANSYKKDDNLSVKKVVVEASSEEELIEKINNVDWNKVSGEKVGARFDFSV